HVESRPEADLQHPAGQPGAGRAPTLVQLRVVQQPVDGPGQQVGRPESHPHRVTYSGATAHSGRASTPASLRCAAVIGAGASVSGSTPPPDFGKAMTSRIDSVCASSAVI